MNEALNLVQGPLVMQTPNAAALAEVLVKAAERFWDAATEQDTPQMWETGREIASWVLSVCHRAEGETARKRSRQSLATPAPPPPAPQTMTDLGLPAGGPVFLPGLQPAPMADPG